MNKFLALSTLVGLREEMGIQTILSMIDVGAYALPEFQRGYVWNREQVKKLMNFFCRVYPIGGLLV